MESSFPNAMARLAAASGHMTPELVGRELDKIPHARRVIMVHIKPRYRDTVVAELGTLGREVEIARPRAGLTV